MYLIIVCGMFVWCSLCVSVLTVSNALLMSSATVIVRSGGSFWLNHVAMELFMLCSVVLVEWLLLKPCCVEMCGMLFVMYRNSVFSSVLLSLREVRWVCMMCLCSCLCWVLELICLLVSMCEGLCCCLVMCCTFW